MKIEIRLIPLEKNPIRILISILEKVGMISLITYAFLFFCFYMSYRDNNIVDLEIFNNFINGFTSNLYLLFLVIILFELIHNYIQFMFKEDCLICGKSKYPDDGMILLNPEEYKRCGGQYARYVCDTHKKPYNKDTPIFDTWKEQDEFENKKKL